MPRLVNLHASPLLLPFPIRCAKFNQRVLWRQVFITEDIAMTMCVSGGAFDNNLTTTHVILPCVSPGAARHWQSGDRRTLG